MGIIIAIPFILTSFIMGLWAKKHPKEKQFNRFIFITVCIAILIESLSTEHVSITQNAAILALSLTYIANIITKKYLQIILQIMALTSLIFSGFILSQNITTVIISTALIIISYYALIQYKKEFAFTLIQLAPIAIAGIYLKPDFAIFIFAIMALLGCGRYFVENKGLQIPLFFIQSYLILLFTLINSFEIAEYYANISIILAGFAFMLISHTASLILKHKHPIYIRLFDQHELRFVLTIKVFIFNTICVALGFLVKMEFINIYWLIGFIITVLSYGFAKMWYLENQHKF